MTACPILSHGTKLDRAEKNILYQEKDVLKGGFKTGNDVLKQENDILKQEIWSLFLKIFKIGNSFAN